MDAYGKRYICAHLTSAALPEAYPQTPTYFFPPRKPHRRVLNVVRSIVGIDLAAGMKSPRKGRWFSFIFFSFPWQLVHETPPQREWISGKCARIGLVCMVLAENHLARGRADSNSKRTAVGSLKTPPATRHDDACRGFSLRIADIAFYRSGENTHNGGGSYTIYRGGKAPAS